tara:strand:- start:304 stop:1029 length:726 start_codon:yes stop_codon:yes gene_type:complete
MKFNNNDWFVVSTGVAPVYENASFNSNYLTEMVFGDSCKILKVKKSWLFVRCDDGYKGWVKNFYGFVSAVKNDPSHIIAYPEYKGFFNPKYPFGAKLNKKRAGSIIIGQKLDYNNILKTLNNLLDIPYKWGGKTSLGFDCSGLVQSVLEIYGFKVPRDSKDQWRFLEPFKIDLEEAQEGDLHFFGKKGEISHVGFSCGGYDIVHSQGYVKKESLDKNHINFNKNLLDIYLSSASIRLKFEL